MTKPTGQQLTASDPEPPLGTLVQDSCGRTWENDGNPPACWVDPDARINDFPRHYTWTKIAGNHGPVTVLEWGDEICPIHDIPETDGVCSSCLADSAASGR